MMDGHPKRNATSNKGATHIFVSTTGSLCRISDGTPLPCAKSVPESDLFMPLGLALGEKQIPQIAENTEKSN